MRHVLQDPSKLVQKLLVMGQMSTLPFNQRVIASSTALLISCSTLVTRAKSSGLTIIAFMFTSLIFQSDDLQTQIAAREYNACLYPLLYR